MHSKSGASSYPVDDHENMGTVVFRPGRNALFWISQIERSCARPDWALPLLPLEFFRHYWQYAAGCFRNFATCTVPPRRASACGAGRAAQCQLSSPADTGRRAPFGVSPFVAACVGPLAGSAIPRPPRGAAKSSSHVTVQRYHFRPTLQLVEIVSPLLHHLPTLGKMRCPVVGAPVRIAHRVG
jgi:hypothetical protein